MKKKILLSMTLASMLGLGLVACNEPTTSTTIPTTSTSVPSTSEDPTSNPTVEEIKVASISVTASKSTLVINEEAAITIGVLPANATNKEVDIVVSDTNIVSLIGNTIKGLKIGTATITVTAKDGSNKNNKIVINVIDTPAPTLVVEVGSEGLTVEAGKNLTLPTYSAKNYKNEDLTSAVEIGDNFETGTITGNVFKAYIAGVHIINFYVVDALGKSAEKDVNITVTPATAENFDTTGFEDPNALKTYGSYKENFAKGKKSPLAAYNDSNNSAKLSSTNEAISGNSLIFDANKTAGSASNSLFFQFLGDSALRGTSANYNVEFDYKVLSEANNLNDVYFGLSYDGFTGLNNSFIASTGHVKDQVYHYSCSFKDVNIPTTGNAYFFLFKLSGSSEETKIAFDNFVFSTKQTVSVTQFVPTVDELTANTGATWNHLDKGCKFDNGETVILNDIPNTEAKAAMQALPNDFSTNVIELTSADSHNFSGLDKNNLIAGKKLVVDFKFYAVNDDGFCMIVMGAGNPTAPMTITKDGKLGTCHFEYKLLAGQTSLNFYGANNPRFDIYIGNITAKLVEADPLPQDVTPNGHKVGDKWEWTERQFGLETKGGIALSAFDDNAEVKKIATMGAAPTKWTFTDATNSNMEYFQASGKIESGCTYDIKLCYYIVSYSGGSLMYNLDNNAFLSIGAITPGYHEETIQLVPTANTDFFSFYVPGSTTTTGVVYMGPLTITLTALAK